MERQGAVGSARIWPRGREEREGESYAPKFTEQAGRGGGPRHRLQQHFGEEKMKEVKTMSKLEAISGTPLGSDHLSQRNGEPDTRRISELTPWQ